VSGRAREAVQALNDAAARRDGDNLQGFSRGPGLLGMFAPTLRGRVFRLGPHIGVRVDSGSPMEGHRRLQVAQQVEAQHVEELRIGTDTSGSLVQQ
jgi:hypothetical protein